MTALLIVSMLCLKCVSVPSTPVGDDPHNPAFHTDGKANYYKLPHDERSPGMFDVIIWYKAKQYEEGTGCEKVYRVYVHMSPKNPIAEKYWRRFWKPFEIKRLYWGPWYDSGLPIELHYWTGPRSHTTVLHTSPEARPAEDRLPAWWGVRKEMFFWVVVTSYSDPLIVDLKIRDKVHREFFAVERKDMEVFFNCLEECTDGVGAPCTAIPRSKYQRRTEPDVHRIFQPEESKR